MKISFRKSLKLIALLISSLLIATVSAAAYVTLQWTVNMTIVANPGMCFVSWSDGTTKANNFSYSVNIFPNIKTIDENITYGVWNWNTTATKTGYMRLASTNTNTTDVISINVTITNNTQIYTRTWASFSDTSWSNSFTAASDTKYAIWIEIQCASTATVGHTPQFTFEMKVVEP
jgi:hypothetical protein